MFKEQNKAMKKTFLLLAFVLFSFFSETFGQVKGTAPGLFNTIADLQATTPVLSYGSELAYVLEDKSMWRYDRTDEEWQRQVYIDFGVGLPSGDPGTAPKLYMNITTGDLYQWGSSGDEWVVATGGTDDQIASEVPFNPTGDILSSDLQSVCVEIQTQLSAVQAALGIANGAQGFGSFTGSTLSDNETAKVLFQEIETNIDNLKVNDTLDVNYLRKNTNNRVQVLNEFSVNGDTTDAGQHSVFLNWFGPQRSGIMPSGSIEPAIINTANNRGSLFLSGGGTNKGTGIFLQSDSGSSPPWKRKSIRFYVGNNESVTVDGLQDAPPLVGYIDALGSWVISDTLPNASSYKLFVDGDAAINGTAGILIKGGTTAERSIGQAGMFRFNSSENKFEFYNGTEWVFLLDTNEEDKGIESNTTDANGDIIITHSLSTDQISVTAKATGTTFYHVQVHSKTSTEFKVRVFEVSVGSAQAVPSTAVTVDWHASKI